MLSVLVIPVSIPYCDLAALLPHLLYFSQCLASSSHAPTASFPDPEGNFYVLAAHLSRHLFSSHGLEAFLPGFVASFSNLHAFGHSVVALISDLLVFSPAHVTSFAGLENALPCLSALLYSLAAFFEMPAIPHSDAGSLSHDPAVTFAGLVLSFLELAVAYPGFVASSSGLEAFLPGFVESFSNPPDFGHSVVALFSDLLVFSPAHVTSFAGLENALPRLSALLYSLAAFFEMPAIPHSDAGSLSHDPAVTFAGLVLSFLELAVAYPGFVASSPGLEAFLPGFVASFSNPPAFDHSVVALFSDLLVFSPAHVTSFAGLEN